MIFIFILVHLVSCSNDASDTSYMCHLNFDNIEIPSGTSYISLERPFHNFVFKRLTNLDNNVPVNRNDFPAYINCQPRSNVIFTTGEGLSITQVNNKLFSVRSVNITSIFINNIQISVSSIHNYKRIILPLQTETYVELNFFNVNEVIIQCIDKEFCAHLAFDDIILFY